ncbi:Integral membrane protein OS=Streptomyces tendae OX=1932 GN=GUR47_20545 PE=4 SV=1 [Streptomyces tendae]
MLPRLRGVLTAVLLTLACLLAPCAVLAGWAVHGPADTDRYVAAVAPLADDPDVREAAADTLGDGFTGLVDEVTAGPVSGSVRLFVRDAARSFTRTEAFREGWDAANRTVHAAVLRALRDDGAAGRPVTVDLAPVTERVRDRLAEDHVPFARRIPVRHTAVTVLPAHETDRLRKGYHVLDVAAVWLPLAAVVFALTGIALAARRRRAVTAAGIGTALGGALLALTVVVGRRLTVTELPGPVDGPAAGAVYDALTETLRTASWLLVALGLTVALASWLTDRYGPRLHRRPRAPRATEPSPPRPTRTGL